MLETMFLSGVGLTWGKGAQPVLGLSALFGSNKPPRLLQPTLRVILSESVYTQVLFRIPTLAFLKQRFPNAAMVHT